MCPVGLELDDLPASSDKHPVHPDKHNDHHDDDHCVCPDKPGDHSKSMTILMTILSILMTILIILTVISNLQNQTGLYK